MTFDEQVDRVRRAREKRERKLAAGLAQGHWPREPRFDAVRDFQGPPMDIPEPYDP